MAKLWLRQLANNGNDTHLIDGGISSLIDERKVICRVFRSAN